MKPVTVPCRLDSTGKITVNGADWDGDIPVHTETSEGDRSFFLSAKDARRLRKALKRAIREAESA